MNGGLLVAGTTSDAGKSVVTANKALLAEDGGTLHDAAAEGGADLYYEASVAGAIPTLTPVALMKLISAPPRSFDLAA